MKILVETSARHVHLSDEHINILFNAGLTVKKPVSQPGQFACNERVNISTAKNTIGNVIILGPARKQTQVEISLTDARTLGITVPVRESGDLAGSAGIKITGPAGEIEISEGVIAAKRHIHFTPEDAEKCGVADKQAVSLKIETGDRSLIFGDVIARVSGDFATAVHIDTDEANAAGITGETYGEIII